MLQKWIKIDINIDTWTRHAWVLNVKPKLKKGSERETNNTISNAFHPFAAGVDDNKIDQSTILTSVIQSQIKTFFLFRGNDITFLHAYLHKEPKYTHTYAQCKSEWHWTQKKKRVEKSLKHASRNKNSIKFFMIFCWEMDRKNSSTLMCDSWLKSELKNTKKNGIFKGGKVNWWDKRMTDNDSIIINYTIIKRDFVLSINKISTG